MMCGHTHPQELADDNREKYCIEVNKKASDPPNKQLCDNCYEKLSNISFNKSNPFDETLIPQYLRDRIVQGDLCSVTFVLFLNVGSFWKNHCVSL